MLAYKKRAAAPNICAFLFLIIFLPSVLAAQPCALNVPSGTATLSNGAYSYCSVNISAGATLFIGGAVTLNVTGDTDIYGAINGVGLGYGSSYAPSLGPGTGADADLAVTVGAGGYFYGGGGGGHGGTGGAWPTVPGGATYDSPNNPLTMGSAGGMGGPAGLGGSPGPGGAALLLNDPTGNVNIFGLIDMSGFLGGFPSSMGTTVGGGGGGGAGGTISILAQGIYGTGNLVAAGGPGGGGTYGGGGGGEDVSRCAHQTESIISMEPRTAREAMAELRRLYATI